MKGEYQWSYYSVDGSFASGQACAKLVEKTPENTGAIFNPTSGQCYRLTGDVYAGGPDYTDHECYAFRVCTNLKGHSNLNQCLAQNVPK